MNVCKDGLLSVSKFAEICNITAETLRYYDREGLLTPDYIDPQTLYRYYSVERYRCVKVICELRKQNFSISQIKDLFDNDDKDFAKEILENNLETIDMQIQQLQNIQESLKLKLRYLNGENLLDKCNIIDEKIFNDRYSLVKKSNKKISNYNELFYTLSAIEKKLSQTELFPVRIFSNTCYMAIIKKNLQLISCGDSPMKIAVQISNNYDIIPEGFYLHKSKSGKYVCMICKCRIFNREEPIKKMLNYIAEKGYKINGDIRVIFLAGQVLISPCINMYYEFQIPVEQ